MIIYNCTLLTLSLNLEHSPTYYRNTQIEAHLVFLNKSPSSSFVFTCSLEITFSWIFYWMKWQNFDMFCSLMIYWIGDGRNSSLIQFCRRWAIWANLFASSWFIHKISQVDWLMALYLDSFDLDIALCFLLFQDTRFRHKKRNSLLWTS